MTSINDPRRKVLKEAVCLLVAETGFAVATDEAIETLVEMLQSLMCEIANQTRCYSELAGRTQAVVGDIVMGLVNLGIDFKHLDKYALRENRPQARSMNPNKNANPVTILQAGAKPSNPSHIPGYLPQLPDAHAYIRTATYKQPETEYEAIREKSANQKRDIEKALTRFLAKTAPETHNLFDDEENQMFPLISSKPAQTPAYLSALNPTDQIFDWEELEYYYLVANRKPSDDNTDSEPEQEMAQDEIEASPPKKRKNKNKAAEVKKEPVVEVVKEPLPPKPEVVDKPQIDNPFLKSLSLA